MTEIVLVSSLQPNETPMPVHRQAASEMGSDYESVLREIKQDEELAEDVGLEKPSASEAAPSVP